MGFLKDMKITPRLITSFLLVSAIAAVIGVLGIGNVVAINGDNGAMYNGITTPLSDMVTLSGMWQRSRVVTRDVILMNEEAAMNGEIDSLTAKFAAFEEAYQKMDGSVTDPEAKGMLQTIHAKLEAYLPYKDQVVALARQNKDAEAETLLQGPEVDGAAGEVTDSITALSDKLNELAGQTKALNDGKAGNAIWMMVALVALGILGSVALGLIASMSISKPIRKVVEAAGQLARGDTGIQLDSARKDEVGSLARSFDEVVGAISRLTADAGMLADAAVAGRFETRADATRHQGSYRAVVEGVNRTLDIVMDKVVWYEALLDAVPLPLSVTDMDMNWTFINKPVEQMLGVKRKDMLGMQCNNWNAGICKTDKCGIARLKSGSLQTFFEQQGMNFQVDTSYILNARGERIGHIEVVQDVTARSRSSAYLKEEVAKIAGALDQLAQGNLSCEYRVGDGDQYTAAERESLLEISGYLASAVTTLRGYVGGISGSLHSMATGDISMAEMERFKGDFEGISESLNAILESFNGMFTEMAIAAEQVSAGTTQVSAGSQALSQGATEQASATEELTASVMEIANQTRQNAENASEASRLSVAARSDATEGDSRMNELQRAMADINEASANISKIIKVIDDIAFQTNLLALNAAVEAARAGQYGKGFAVVAEEVRNLAQRSAGAAKETTQMIEESIKKVKDGTRIANETAQALKRIVAGVEKATELVGGIAEASNSQAMAVAQVNSGIEQVAQVTQTNSATAEESAAASEELSGQASLLKDMVGRFTLRGQMAGGHRAALSGRSASKPQAPAKPAAGKPMIALNDREFGKY